MASKNKEMPGRRNYARERQQHALEAPAKQAALYELLRSTLPERDRAVIGFPAIIDLLDGIGVRRLNGKRLTYRIIRRWSHTQSFPLLRGNRQTGRRIAPLSTHFAILAWTLTRFHNGDIFAVVQAGGFTTMRSFIASLDCSRAA